MSGGVLGRSTRGVGCSWAVYSAASPPSCRTGLPCAGVSNAEPDPLACLLCPASVLTFFLMFVIMVGQDVLGKAGDKRSMQTFLDAEVILHECLQLQEHLTAQDRLIVKICAYIHQNAPKDHPIPKQLDRAH